MAHSAPASSAATAGSIAVTGREVDDAGMAERTPKRRASYEAAHTTERGLRQAIVTTTSRSNVEALLRLHLGETLAATRGYAATSISDIRKACGLPATLHLYPDRVRIVCAGVDVICDVGGQDIKCIRCDANGRVTNFLMNDKCAAGTGRDTQ